MSRGWPDEESRETLQRLADDTGGLLAGGTSELGAGLGRMLADNESFYLVAYEPTNTKRDGRFRKIELRLPRLRRSSRCAWPWLA